MRGNTRLMPAGQIIITDPGTPLVEHDTLQCCHCGMHFVRVIGSGNKRGFCMNCRDVTCGKPECDPCNPIEKQMDIAEGTRNPTAVSVPTSPEPLWIPDGISDR